MTSGLIVNMRCFETWRNQWLCRNTSLITTLFFFWEVLLCHDLLIRRTLISAKCMKIHRSDVSVMSVYRKRVLRVCRQWKSGSIVDDNTFTHKRHAFCKIVWLVLSRIKFFIPKWLVCWYWSFHPIVICIVCEFNQFIFTIYIFAYNSLPFTEWILCWECL